MFESILNLDTNDDYLQDTTTQMEDLVMGLTAPVMVLNEHGAVLEAGENGVGGCYLKRGIFKNS